MTLPWAKRQNVEKRPSRRYGRCKRLDAKRQRSSYAGLVCITVSTGAIALRRGVVQWSGATAQSRGAGVVASPADESGATHAVWEQENRQLACAMDAFAAEDGTLASAAVANSSVRKQGHGSSIVDAGCDDIASRCSKWFGRKGTSAGPDVEMMA